MKIKFRTILASALCFGLLIFIFALRTITYYQLEDIDIVESNPHRLQRCVGRDVASWMWEESDALLCVNTKFASVRVGLVRTGDEIAVFVEHILLKEMFGANCTPSIQFESFSVEEMDDFEKYDSYPPQIAGWLLYGGHFEARPQRWPSIPIYGTIGLSEENCFNGDTRAAFGFLTYADCGITDNVNFFAFPLGPYVATHPSFLSLTHVKPIDERNVFLNARFTMTPRKPSRRVWLEKAEQFCSTSNAQCETNTDWLYASGISSLLQKHDSYVDMMQDSVLTLCPSGNNFEQYRIWEAIFAGSIPVVEDVSSQLQNEAYASPSYSKHYYCVPNDVHFVLKESGAPVFYAGNIHELAVVLENVYSFSDIGKMQMEMIRWKERLFMHYRRLLVRLILKHFN